MVAPVREKRGRTSLVALASCGLLLAAAASGCGSDEWPGSKEVHVGVKADQPGTGYRTGPYGSRSGFDIRIADMVANTLGKKLKFEDVSSGERETALGGETPHFVIATFSINDDRLAGKTVKPAVDFVGPYAKTHSGILVRKEDISPIRELPDLEGKNVCTWPGTTSGDMVSNVLPSHHEVEGDDAGDCVRRLTEGDGVDAVFTDTLILQGFAQDDDSLQVVKPNSGTFQYYGIALPKGHRDVCERVKEGLVRYMNSGKWDTDFKDNFESIKNVGMYKTTPRQVDRFSCRDKVGR